MAHRASHPGTGKKPTAHAAVAYPRITRDLSQPRTEEEFRPATQPPGDHACAASAPAQCSAASSPAPRSPDGTPAPQTPAALPVRHPIPPRAPAPRRPETSGTAPPEPPSVARSLPRRSFQPMPRPSRSGVCHPSGNKPAAATPAHAPLPAGASPAAGRTPPAARLRGIFAHLIQPQPRTIAVAFAFLLSTAAEVCDLLAPLPPLRTR